MKDQERIDYLKIVEQHARANAEFGIASAEKLSKDSGTLLNMLIAGIGGGIALIVQLSKQSSWLPELMIGVSVVTAYLTAIAIVLMLTCIKTRKVYAPTNSPKNLLVALDKKYDEVGLGDAIKSILWTADETIDKNRQSNETLAQRLDRCRMATVLTPVVLVVTFVLVHLL